MATLPPPVSDLAAWVGQDIEPADPRAGAVLSAATALARGYSGQAWDDANVPDDVAFVVTQAAARVWLNPDGVVSESIDDHSRRYADSAGVGLFFTDEEKSILSRYRSGGGLWVQPYSSGPLEMTLDELFVRDLERGDASGTYLPGQS